MITSTRTSQSAPGKHAQSIAFAKEVAHYLKSKHHFDVVVKVQIAGPVGRITWVANHASLAAYEEASAKLMADEAYHALIEKAAGIFIPGHSHDTLWRSV